MNAVAMNSAIAAGYSSRIESGSEWCKRVADGTGRLGEVLEQKVFGGDTVLLMEDVCT